MGLPQNYEMQDGKPISTLMASNNMIDNDKSLIEIEITKYWGIIRSLLYLTASRPNIMFSVCMFARFQSSTREPILEP